MLIAFPGRSIPAAALVCVLFLYYESSGPAGFTAGAQQPETAEWVARQVDARDIGRDGRFQLKMRLFDRQQRVRERELTILSLRAQAGSGDRTLIRFNFPTTF